MQRERRRGGQETSLGPRHSRPGPRGGQLHACCKQMEKGIGGGTTGPRNNGPGGLDARSILSHEGLLPPLHETTGRWGVPRKEGKEKGEKDGEKEWKIFSFRLQKSGNGTSLSEGACQRTPEGTGRNVTHMQQMRRWSKLHLKIEGSREWLKDGLPIRRAPRKETRQKILIWADLTSWPMGFGAADDVTIATGRLSHERRFYAKKALPKPFKT